MRSFAVYVLIQVVAYAIDFGSFVLLLPLGIDALVANVAGKLLAGCFAFVCHRRFTFSSSRSGDARRQALRYGLLLAINLPLASAVLWLLMFFVAPPALAKFVADVACVLLTYALSKKFVFLADAAKAGAR